MIKIDKQDLIDVIDIKNIGVTKMVSQICHTFYKQKSCKKM